MLAELPTGAAVERALAGIFARPEFAPRAETLPARGLRWVGQAIKRALESLAAALGIEGSAGRVVVWGVVAIAVGAALAFGVLLLRRVWRLRRGLGVPRRTPGAAAHGVPVPDAARWEEEARRAAAERRWHDALLALYPALLLRLEAREVLRTDPAKTPGDYRREASVHAWAVRPFDAFLRQYERVVYGTAPLDGTGYAHAAECARALGVHG